MDTEVSLVDAVRAREAFIPIAKARVIEVREQMAKGPSGTAETVASNQVTPDDYSTAFTNLGALDPVYDPEMLALLFEHSNSLRQNIDAYTTNIDGFGHRFDPILDLDAADADQRLANAIEFDRLRAGDDSDELPSKEEVAALKKKVIKTMRHEKSRLELFFEFCSPQTSFVTLRRHTRQDLESMGNAYWEVLRNRGGDIVHFCYVPAFTIRLLPLDPEPVTFKQRVRVSEISFDEIDIVVRTRRYVQIVEGRAVFFKELGDHRLISSKSGMVYPDEETMLHTEPDARAATELLHFRVHSVRSPYGVPRWIGNLLAVIGSRQAEEVNFTYFENKSVPPLAILVSGGRMSQSSVDRVQDYIESNIKGKRNFHKILVLEAESPGGSTANDANAAKMKIDIKPLTAAQHQDALFQNYDERNIDKVGQSFRLPRMLRGDIRDFNRSTADAALTFAEVQVFEPERQEFDFIINRKILSAMGIQFWRFVSLAPVIRDAVAMSEIIKNLSNASVITPEEARELAGDVFNRDFKRLTASWVRQPSALTIAGIPVEDEPSSSLAGPTDDDNFGTEGGNVAPVRPPGEGVEARAEKRLAKALTREAHRLLALKGALDALGQKQWNDHLRATAIAGE